MPGVGEGRWQPVGDAVPDGWAIGVVDPTTNMVWVTSPDYVAPAPDLTQPWPGRPAAESPRAKYRSDGSVESAGYLPNGHWVEATPVVRYVCPLCGGKGYLGA